MFASTQFDGNFTFSQATDSGVSPAKSRDAPGTIPVTVKKIIEASQSGDEKSNFLVAGVDVANVSVVGMITSKTERVTDVNFTLDDGTGRIDCIRWVNEGYDTKEMSEIEEGMYARVNGRLKSFQGKKQIAAFSVRPVTNFDEVTCHFIECIHFHLKNSHLQQADASTQFENGQGLSTPTQKGTGASNAYQAPVSNPLSGLLNGDGLKGFDQMVLDYLQRPSSFANEKGMHRDVLHKELKIPVEKLMYSLSLNGIHPHP
ncbi:replication protein A 32 kDa subunit A isoform X2 [Daucus carota subsp. sativus]|uniref:replication protein A 32 kDa subunit A isoform X2 n=1 Tax=Daucus carota subsp. sativus TaxID=79200 RepID=UPI0007EFB42D|nr:PREDICTED: replication protein A 32 kDa subunit A isoform X2 [Daucus carota subsp. sativus]